MEHDFYCENVLNGKVFVNIEYETENILAFRHTHPTWSFHIVVIPKKHIRDLLEIEDGEIIKEIFEVIALLIKKHNLQKTNFKIVSNGGSFQDSKHIHFHLLSGEVIKKL